MSWILCATLAFQEQNCVQAATGNSAGDRQIIVIYSGKVHPVDLSRTDLSQTVTDSAFTLVVDKIDLAGIQLVEQISSKASFRNSRLRGLGAMVAGIRPMIGLQT